MHKGHGGGARPHSGQTSLSVRYLQTQEFGEINPLSVSCWSKRPMREASSVDSKCPPIYILLFDTGIAGQIGYSLGFFHLRLYKGWSWNQNIQNTWIHTEITLSDYQSWLEGTPGTGAKIQTLLSKRNTTGIVLCSVVSRPVGEPGWRQERGDAPSTWSPYTFKHNLLCSRKLHVNPS